MDEKCSFIDKNGNEIFDEEISSHIGLAMKLLENNEKLRKEYEQSGKKDPIDFLIIDKGLLKLTKQAYYRKCVYHSKKISDRQRQMIQYYHEEGYSSDDLFIREKQNREDNFR